MRARASFEVSGLLVLATLAGCVNSPQGDDDGDDPDAGITLDPTRYVGIAGNDLSAGIPTFDEVGPRRRLKPYSALTGELQRVVDTTPAGIELVAPELGARIARYGTEPAISQGALRAIHGPFLTACTTYVGAETATYNVATSATNAPALCDGLAATLWSRPLVDAERTLCVNHVVGITGGTDLDRWARACVAMLAAPDFLTY